MAATSGAVAGCVFCGIVAGTEPSVIVRADERTLAFLNIAPATPGHTLVVPRRHARNVFDVDGDDLAAVARAAREVALLLRDRLGAPGISLFQANERAGWQDVFHLHVHVVPRWPDDPLVVPWRTPRVPLSELEATGRLIRGAA